MKIIMLNRTTLSGRLTDDPILKETPNRVSVTSFSLAVERNFSDKETGKRPTDFFNIVAWRATADFIAKYFVKGQAIIIDGSLQSRKYKDKNGNARTIVEVVVDKAYFGDSKKSEPHNTQNAPSSTTDYPPPTYDDYSDYQDVYTGDDDTELD